MPSYTLNGLTAISHIEKNITPADEEHGKDYIFNDKNAGLYQEWEVVKINKYKVKQERIMGIDLYNIYNNLPENNKKPSSSFFFSSSNETKKPIIKIADIIKCEYISKGSFLLELILPDNRAKTKQNIYEVKNINIRNEIVSKINYLIVSLLYLKQ